MIEDGGEGAVRMRWWSRVEKGDGSETLIIH